MDCGELSCSATLSWLLSGGVCSDLDDVVSDALLLLGVCLHHVALGEGVHQSVLLDDDLSDVLALRVQSLAQVLSHSGGGRQSGGSLTDTTDSRERKGKHR